MFKKDLIAMFAVGIGMVTTSLYLWFGRVHPPKYDFKLEMVFCFLGCALAVWTVMDYFYRVQEEEFRRRSVAQWEEHLEKMKMIDGEHDSEMTKIEKRHLRLVSSRKP